MGGIARRRPVDRLDHGWVRDGKKGHTDRKRGAVGARYAWAVHNAQGSRARRAAELHQELRIRAGGGAACPHPASEPFVDRRMLMGSDMSRRTASLDTPTDLGASATHELSGPLNILLAGMFAL